MSLKLKKDYFHKRHKPVIYLQLITSISVLLFLLFEEYIYKSDLLMYLIIFDLIIFAIFLVLNYKNNITILNKSNIFTEEEIFMSINKKQNKGNVKNEK